MTGEGEESAYFSRIVDEESLASYFERELGSVEEYRIEHHQEGHSNETLFVAWGERALVVRRPPPGETADTAHDVLREYRVMDHLQNTPVRVPPTVLACEDESVLDCEFYVMERVTGSVLRETEPERFATPDHRRRIGAELIDGLCEIHAVDPETVGLGEFGPFDVTTEEREVPALYDVMEWLTANAPDAPTHTLVQGDYKLDNVMFAPSTPPELIAVFDWELSTLGNPLVDLGWLLSYWWDAGDPDPPAATDSLNATFMTREGYPTRKELVERYEERTGIEYEHDRFYRALAVYKLAGLGEMFFRRYLEGNADDPLYPKMETGVPELADRALRIIEGEEPL
ncbi:MAG: phosphotransferase family protein [Halobacteriales archaeon SW_9_67_24]|nr:MAG: phosphotransferase family protein [Halobacteriales archaeon SW_9_67_24]